MPVLINPKHEKFAQLLAEGKFAVEAYEQAGYRRDDGNATTLAKKPAIRGRVQELRGWAAQKTKITAESLIERYEHIYKRALESGQLSAGVGAVKEISVLTGHRIERKEVGQPGEFDAMSDEQLEAAIRERFARLFGDATSDAGIDTTRH